MIDQVVSHYRILEELGEGGFGLVYLAEQIEPVRRRVALKVLKTGMDTRAVLARFEAERQALALMDHPHIAKVLDAGQTDNGRPYFVMELVKGDPLNAYCDRHKLTNRERLELFGPICQAVQHAHQKGVIHRDLKPSNILVTVVDGEPVPKVIDFGIAKAISNPLTDKTLLTMQGQVIGTPAYMSPEQAERTGLDVDTTTDVYSLGVLLYELLSGHLPFDQATLADVGLEGIPRVIREVDPPTPSSRLGKSGRDTWEIAARRRVEPGALVRQIRGELDWIVMRAMAKDRTRRYQTANALALDIRRYLQDEPVEAGPPSTTYRMRKFARRHRMAFALSFAILFGLLGAAAGLTVALIQSHRQRGAVELALQETARARDAAVQARAESEAVTDFLADMLASADPDEGGKDVTVREVLDATAGTVVEACTDYPLIMARLQTVMGVTYRELGEFESAEPLLEAGLATRRSLLGDEDSATLVSLREIGQLQLQSGQYDRAESTFVQVLRARRTLLGPDDRETLASQTDLAAVLLMQERDEEAVPMLEQALAGARKIMAREGPSLDNRLFMSTVSVLSVAYTSLGRYQDAEPLLVELLQSQRALYGDDHVKTVAAKQNLARLYRLLGRLADAEPLYEKSVEIARRAYGEEHPSTLRFRSNLALLYSDMGRYPEAEQLSLQVVEARRRLLGEKNPSTLASMVNLALVYSRRGDFAKSASICQRVVDLCPDVVGEDHLYTLTARSLIGLAHVERDEAETGEAMLAMVLAKLREAFPAGHWRIGQALSNHAHALTAMQQYREAEADLLEGLEVLTDAVGHDHLHTQQAIQRILALYEAWGRPDLAQPWLDKVAVAASGPPSALDHEMGTRYQ